MSNNDDDKEDDILKRFNIGVRLGVARALDEHKRMGRSIVVWRDGKIVEVAAEDIVVPPFPDQSEIDALD